MGNRRGGLNNNNSRDTIQQNRNTIDRKIITQSITQQFTGHLQILIYI